MEHQSTLKRLGYVTRGRVIAKNQYPGNAPDLAIVELDGLPETYRELDISIEIDYSKMRNRTIHVLGHPSNRPLWQLDRGDFEGDDGEILHLSANAYHGNSGGPVLNEYGELIGITQGGDKKTKTYAVPRRSVIYLHKTLKPTKIFSIHNNTEFPMSYEVQWEKDGDWKEIILSSKEERPHVMLYDKNFLVHPKIRFKNIQNGKAPTEIVQTLKTKFRKFGRGITDLKTHIEFEDAFRYQFEYNSETKTISLEESKFVQAFAIHNATKFLVFFQYRWHEDAEWTEADIEPGAGYRFLQESEKVSASYPRIRFDESTGSKRKYPEKSWVLETQTERSSKSEKIRDDLNNANPRRHHFKYDSKNKKLSLIQGLPISDKKVKVWFLLLLVVFVLIILILGTREIFFKRDIASQSKITLGLLWSTTPNGLRRMTGK